MANEVILLSNSRKRRVEDETAGTDEGNEAGIEGVIYSITARFTCSPALALALMLTGAPQVGEELGDRRENG